MRDHSHIWTEGSDICAHCGQPLPGAPESPTYGRKRASPAGLIVTILLHLLLVAIYLLQPARNEKGAKPSPGTSIVYIAPLEGKPKSARQQHAPKKTVKSRPTKSQPVRIVRLPNTITLPEDKPVEVVKAEPKKEMPAEPDMAAYIEARRKQRGAPTESDQPAEESEEARAMRHAMANVAAANGRSRDGDEATLGLSNRTFHSVDISFSGWNSNFKRNWLTKVTAEIGNEPDVETAAVKKMIELIQKGMTPDFIYHSRRLGRDVKLSARPRDTEQLKEFLFKELFEDYRPPPRH